MVNRLPQAEQRLQESDAPLDHEEAAPTAQVSTTIEELVSNLAHDVNNPLAVVVANLDVLTELVSEIGVAVEPNAEAQETTERLAAIRLEAEVCLQDVARAVDRIKTVVQRLQRSQDEVRQPVEAEPTTETKRTVLHQAEARILVVDDDEDVAWALQRILDDYDVVMTLKAREALDLVRSGERFNAIVCDLMMPEMLGSDLYEEIKRAAPDQAARMIFVTGGATTTTAKEFLKSAALPVLIKPFGTRELRGFVQRLLWTEQKYDSIRTVSTVEEARAKLDDLVGIALSEAPSLSLEDATCRERANVLAWIGSTFNGEARERLRRLFESVPP